MGPIIRHARIARDENPLIAQRASGILPDPLRPTDQLTTH